MTARNHHYVPQCYLKGFAHHREKPKIFVIDGKTEKTFSTHPQNVAQERDFHRVDIEGHEPDALENAFARVEGEIAPALERASGAGRFVSEEDRILVLNLAALLAVKNPRQRENMRDFAERLNKTMMQMILSNKETWDTQVRRMKEDGFWDDSKEVSYDEMRDFVREDEYTISMATEMHLSLELQAFDAVLPYFIDRQWTSIVAPPKTSGFITCDHPVALFWTDEKRQGSFPPPGHGLKNTTVVFPVSSRLVILGQFEKGPEFSFQATAEQVASINNAMILNADRQIYARDSGFDYMSTRADKMLKGVNLLQELNRPKGR